nr:MAG: Transcriptional regulator PadR-like family protein [Bacteriophage sp.]
MENISERIPFLSVAAVRTSLRKLKEAGLIIVENFNATPYDHTKWYTLTEKAEELIKSSACRPENVLY